MLNKIFPDRYKILTFDNGKEYIIDKAIFSIGILILLIFAVTTFFILGADRNYYTYINCPINEYNEDCFNPLYLKYPECKTVLDGQLCEQKFLSSGFKYGKDAPPIVKNWYDIIFTLFFIIIMVNHLIHNNKKKLVV